VDSEKKMDTVSGDAVNFSVTGTSQMAVIAESSSIDFSDGAWSCVLYLHLAYDQYRSLQAVPIVLSQAGTTSFL
jgi:hypothetical protein